MTQKQAHNRYMKIFVPSMLGYVIGIFLVVYLRDHTQTNNMALAVISLLPTVCIFIFMGGHWRYINEIDEYLRTRQMRSLVFGLAVILAIATGWGLVEELIDASNFPIFYLVPVFFFAQGGFFCIGNAMSRRHDRSDTE